MQISIKNFNINMDVKSSGIEFEVRTPDGNSQLGDCYLTMSGLVWCKGKTSKAKGNRINWNDLIVIMSSKEATKAAIKAAKSV